MKKIVLICIIALLCGVAFADPPPEPTRTLVGWGISGKNTEAFIADAEAVGFDALITWSTDPVFLAKAVSIGQAHKIKVFACISPTGRNASAWKQKHPEVPFPWQVMSEAEKSAASFLSSGKNKYLVPYQWGGEPLMTHEVLLSKLICFNNMDGRELFKPVIDRIVAVAGIAGLAFDGFGYQNYHSCHCARCIAKLEEYRVKHPDMSQEDSANVFYRDALVGYINHLANYARSQNSEIKTTIHIWPVFSPEPLYGNRLDLDYCGQTAAWYVLWPKQKIAEYSRTICKDAKRYHHRQEGVGMIGYYDRPGEFPVKTAARVDMELRTMINNGCTRIQVCGAADVIKNKEIAAVFKKYFR